MSLLYSILDVTHKLISVVASSIAVYLFFFKRDAIKSVLMLLTSYASQQTLGELRSKIDRLNTLSYNEPSNQDEIIILFNEIVGQIKGNKKLCSHCNEIVERISKLADNPKKLTEPAKRSVISQLRELLRHYDLINYADMRG